MFAFVTALHIIICIALIMIVLLQTGKGAEMGAAFGGSTQTVFGSSGPAGFLNKLTTGVAILFMITSLTLCYLTGRLPIPTIMEEKNVEQSGEVPQNVEGLPAAEVPQNVEQMPPAPVAEQGEPMPESLPE
jgi:preprotein translocase subunit SecG